jgi:hypothetical protein
MLKHSLLALLLAAVVYRVVPFAARKTAVVMTSNPPPLVRLPNTGVAAILIRRSARKC